MVLVICFYFIYLEVYLFLTYVISIPVSYTHLDVYKRQGLHNTRARAHTQPRLRSVLVGRCFEKVDFFRGMVPYTNTLNNYAVLNTIIHSSNY